MLLAGIHCFSQNGFLEDSTVKKYKSLVLFAGGGGNWYTSSITHPYGDPSSFKKVFVATTVRIMWYPQYRLRVGLETGTVNFYSYEIENGNNKGRLDLTAIPVIIMWSMPIVKGLNVYAGIGSYFLTSRLDFRGKVKSSNLSLGSNIALAYQQPVSKRLQLSLEAKWMNAFVSKNSAVGLQMQLAYKFLEWRSR
jgi:hypothetical protein